jgi:hypothetical protein
LVCQKLCCPFVREYLWVKAKRVEHLRNKWERGGAEDLDQQRALQVCPGILQYYYLQSSGIREILGLRRPDAQHSMSLRHVTPCISPQRGAHIPCYSRLSKRVGLDEGRIVHRLSDLCKHPA